MPKQIGLDALIVEDARGISQAIIGRSAKYGAGGENSE